jgi:hypothetical protein
VPEPGALRRLRHLRPDPQAAAVVRIVYQSLPAAGASGPGPRRVPQEARCDVNIEDVHERLAALMIEMATLLEKLTSVQKQLVERYYLTVRFKE